jgi:hypothetical protein
MIKNILKLALLVIIGLLVYNYFFGDAEEKATSKKVFNEVKEVGVAIKDFVKDEHQRIKDGKFDKVLNKLEGAYEKVERKVSKLDPEMLDEFSKLKKRKRELERDLEDKKGTAEKPMAEEDREKIQDDLKDLLERSNDLFDKVLTDEDLQ